MSYITKLMIIPLFWLLFSIFCGLMGAFGAPEPEGIWIIVIFGTVMLAPIVYGVVITVNEFHEEPPVEAKKTKVVSTAKDLDKESAKSIIENKVYESAFLFEELEYAGKVHGNGHHMMQKVAAFASDLMEERWIDKDK